VNDTIKAIFSCNANDPDGLARIANVFYQLREFDLSVGSLDKNACLYNVYSSKPFAPIQVVQ